MAIKQPRSELTFNQQSHVRANLMRSATQIANQLHDYIRKGTITINKVEGGKATRCETTMTTERLAAYRLVLDRTVPTLSATEITHRTGLEGMTTEQLTEKLAALVKARPELGEKLFAITGGKTLEAMRVEPPADGGARGGSEGEPAQDEHGREGDGEVQLGAHGDSSGHLR